MQGTTSPYYGESKGGSTSLSKGRGSEGKRGGFAPSLKPLPPLLKKERGIKGVRLPY